jgi:hypothetical protein
VNRAHPDGGTIDDLELDSGAQLRVRVTLDNRPLPDEPIDLACNERRLPVRTDDRGRFALWPAPAAPCNLLARARGRIGRAYYDPSVAQASGLDVVLELQSGASIEGKVVDAKSGEPRPGAWLSLRDPHTPPELRDSDDLRATAISDPEGRFHFDDLLPGAYTVESAAGGNEVDPVAVEVRSGQQVSATVLAHSSPDE